MIIFPDNPVDGQKEFDPSTDGHSVTVWTYSKTKNQWTYTVYSDVAEDVLVYTDQVLIRGEDIPPSPMLDPHELRTQKDINHYLNEHGEGVDLSHLDEAINELRETDDRHDDEIGTLEAKVEALEGAVIDGQWRMASRSTPREGDFDLIAEQGGNAGNTWIAKTIRFHKTDLRGENFSFASARVGDYIRIGGAGASCVYQVNETFEPSQYLEWQSFGVDHITSIHYPVTGQPFDFEFLPAFDATAYATKAYVDDQDDVVREYVDNAIKELPDPPSLDGYATEEYVQEELGKVSGGGGGAPRGNPYVFRQGRPKDDLQPGEFTAEGTTYWLHGTDANGCTLFPGKGADPVVLPYSSNNCVVKIFSEDGNFVEGRECVRINSSYTDGVGIRVKYDCGGNGFAYLQTPLATGTTYYFSDANWLT